MDKILTRAEKFFRKGNFLLARKEFALARDGGVGKDVAEKIEICEDRIRNQEADEYIKRGRKHLKKKNIKEALLCFEKAGQFRKEEWVEERIKALRQDLHLNVSLVEAQKAESQKEYEKALSLYEEAYVTQKDEALLVRKAVCLVKSGKYEDALLEMKDLTVVGDEGLYHYGFALAKTGRYFDALIAWERVLSSHESFVKQKKEVLCFYRSEALKRVAQGSDFFTVFDQSSQLLKIYREEWLKELVAYTEFRAVEQLWNAGAYEEILRISLPYPTHDTPQLPALYGLLFFKLAPRSKKYYREAISFFLTAIFRDNMCPDEGEDERKKIRGILLQKLESMIRDNCSDSDIYKHLQIEKKAVTTFRLLADEAPRLGNKVITPYAASLLSVSAEILELLKENISVFPDDEEDFMVVGSYFSSARESMYLIDKGEYKKAIQCLPENSGDEFSQYCRQRASFRRGASEWETDGNSMARYFIAAAPLIKRFARYEKELVSISFNSGDIDEYDSFENIFKNLYRDNKSEEIKKALSLAISNKTELMVYEGSVKVKTAENMYKRALSVYSANEHASGKLDGIKEAYEVEKLHEAFTKGNLHKGATIAARTNYEKVKEMYFAYVDFNIRSVKNKNIPVEEKTFIYSDLLEMSLRVDEEHPLISTLHEALDTVARC